MSQSTYYFTTRDLLLMAALAALGGIASTAINTLGDAMQSVLGFAGTTQWAAGLHVLMLTLAGGLVGKLGAGTITGLLKGGVELLTGNTSPRQQAWYASRTSRITRATLQPSRSK